MIRLLIVLLALIAAVLYALWHVGQKLRRRRTPAQTPGSTSARTGPDPYRYFSRRSQKGERAIEALAAIDDPRIATAVALAAIAQSDGPISRAERAVILHEMATRMGITDQQAGELFDHGQFLAADVTNLDRTLSHIAEKISQTCDDEQRRDIAEMAMLVAVADGEPGDIERMAVERFARVLSASEV